jgi:hypothetical protein
MYALRRWSVRHARLLEAIYTLFERALVRLHPVWRRIGYARLEKPFALSERVVKGLLFDCQMCGQCMLTATGMSCPLNCPKKLLNGPCGGVRANGNCEVEPQMRCVWVDAWEGSRRMRTGAAIEGRQQPLNFHLQGRSSWLRVVRDRVPPQAQVSE